jgi:hypothetical protein
MTIGEANAVNQLLEYLLRQRERLKVALFELDALDQEMGELFNKDPKSALDSLIAQMKRDASR